MTDEQFQTERKAFIEHFTPLQPMWGFQDDGTGGFHNQVTEWAWIGWQAARAKPREALHMIASTTTDRGAREEALRALGDCEGKQPSPLDPIPGYSVLLPADDEVPLGDCEGNGTDGGKGKTE